MLIGKLPFKENGNWVVYDFALIKRNKLFIKAQKSMGKSFLIISIILLYLFFLPFGNYFKQTSHAETFKEDPIQKLNLKPVSTDFSLIIPKLSINVPVTANWDPNIRSTGVSQAMGTALPGQPGNIFLFGHSSDYPWINNPFSTVFLSLPTLTSGDKVYLVYQNNLYLFTVVKQDIVNANEISYLRPDRYGNKLFLQTCWPPGTDWQRLIVTADLDKQDPI